MAGGPVGGHGPNRVIEFAVDKRLIAADGVTAAAAFGIALLFAPQQAYSDVQPVVWQSAVKQAPRVIPQIVAGPQLADLTQQPFFKAPTPLKQGPVPPPTVGAPQPDPSQLAASVWRSVVAGQTPPVIPRVSGAPQLLDLTQQAVLSKPLTTPQGPVPPLTAGASQADPSQIAAVIWKSQPAAPIVANPVASFFAIPPQIEDRPSAVIWRSLVSGKTPPVIPFIRGFSQADPSQLPAQVWPSLSTPPAVAGVTVWPNAAIPPQFDPSINATMLWTPSTFSPSAQVIIPDVDTHDGVGGGARIVYKRPHKKLHDEIEAYFSHIGLVPTEQEVVEIAHVVAEHVPDLEARRAVEAAIRTQVLAVLSQREQTAELIALMALAQDEDDAIAVLVMMETLH